MPPPRLAPWPASPVTCLGGMMGRLNVMLWSSHVRPAVDLKYLPGDVARGGREQELDWPGNVTRLCNPAQWNGLGISLAVQPLGLLFIRAPRASTQKGCVY